MRSNNTYGCWVTHDMHSTPLTLPRTLPVRTGPFQQKVLHRVTKAKAILHAWCDAGQPQRGLLCANNVGRCSCMCKAALLSLSECQLPA